MLADHYNGFFKDFVEDSLLFKILPSLSDEIKKLNPNMDAFCVANDTQPLLSFEAKGSRIGQNTFLFVEALRQWESLQSKLDLNEAYMKARGTFTGKYIDFEIFKIKSKLLDSKNQRVRALSHSVKM